jgi:hypothetical protein
MPLPNFGEMTADMIRVEFEGERERCNTLEKDLFKVTTHCRKLEQ